MPERCTTRSPDQTDGGEPERERRNVLAVGPAGGGNTDRDAGAADRTVESTPAAGHLDAPGAPGGRQESMISSISDLTDHPRRDLPRPNGGATPISGRLSVAEEEMLTSVRTSELLPRNDTERAAAADLRRSGDAAGEKPTLFFACEALHRLHQREVARQSRELSRELFEDVSESESLSVADALLRVLHTAVLGRLADRCRFTLEQTEFGDAVSYDSLYRELLQAERLTAKENAAVNPDPVAAAAALRRKDASDSEGGAADPAWKESFDRVWGSWDRSVRMANTAAARHAAEATRAELHTAEEDEDELLAGTQRLVDDPDLGQLGASKLRGSFASKRPSAKNLTLAVSAPEDHEDAGPDEALQRELVKVASDGDMSRGSPRNRAAKGNPKSGTHGAVSLADVMNDPGSRADVTMMDVMENTSFGQDGAPKSEAGNSAQPGAGAQFHIDGQVIVSDSGASDEEGLGGKDNDDPTIARNADDFFTFRELLRFQFPSYPETTTQQREALLELSKRPVVSRHDVRRRLGIAGNSEIVRFLFATGADVLAGDVFYEAAAALGKQPCTVSFAPEFTDYMVGVSRRLATLLPNLLILILALALLPLAAKSSHLSASRAVEAVINDEWAAGCDAATPGTGGPGGADSADGCSFWLRTLTTSRYFNYDVQRYFRRAAVRLIWRDTDPLGTVRAADRPIGSLWPVGGLLIRHVRATDGTSFTDASTKDAAAPLLDCAASNMTTGALHLVVGLNFQCGAVAPPTLIPFNATTADALSLAEAATVANVTRAGGSSAMNLDFAGFSRESGLLVHTRVTVALPEGGGAFPRYDITAIDRDVATFVLPILMVQAVSTVGVVVDNAWSLWQGRSAHTFDLLRSVLSLVLLAVAYVYLNRARGFVDDALGDAQAASDVFQTTHIASGIDGAAQDYHTGISTLGFWVLFFVGMMGRFLRDIPGLELVVQILQRSAFELVCLVAIFAAWTCGFVFVAMALFGATTAGFANATSASLTLLRYFMAGDNLKELEQHNPVLGPAFWFTYMLFVVFFALNLLIAVMTAPLADIRKDMKLDQDMLDHIGRRLSSAGAAGDALRRAQAVESHRVESHATANDADLGRDQTFAATEAVEATTVSAVAEAAKGADDENALRRWTEWYVYSRFVMPLLAVGYNCRPLGTRHWVTVDDAIRTLYASGRETPVATVVAAADTVLRTLATDRVREVVGGEWSTPLLRHTIQAELIKGRPSLAFTIAIIASESSFNAVRDSRLLVAIYRYNRFDARIQRILGHQERLHGLVRDQTSRISRKLGLAEQAAAQLVSRLTQDELLDVVNGDMDVRLGASAAPQLGEDAEDDPLSAVAPAAAPEEGASSGVPPPTDRSAAPPADGPEEAVVHLPATLAPLCARYNFGKHLVSKLHVEGPHRLLYTVGVVIFVIWLAAPFITTVNHSAFLSQTLTEGLRDMPFTGRCQGPDCASGQTFEYSYAQVSQLAEFRDWASEVAAVQLFSQSNTTSTSGAAGGVPVAWDYRVRRVSPVTVRILLADEVECCDPSRDAVAEAQNPALQRLMDQFTAIEAACHRPIESTQSYRKSPLSRPVGLSVADLPDSALRHRSTCESGQHDPYYGVHATYPCSGFHADFDDAAAFLRVMESEEWLSSAAVRFIATSATFESGAARAHFSMLLEVADAGGAVMPHAVGFPDGPSPTLSALQPQRVVYGVVLVLRLLVYLATLAVYLVRRYRLGKAQGAAAAEEDRGRRRAAETAQARAIRPVFPLLFVIAGFVYFVLGFAVVRNAQDRAALHAALMVAHAALELTVSVIFPIASLRSRPVQILVDAMSISIVNCLYVLPLLLIFYAAFILAGVVLFGRSVPEFSNGRMALRSVLLGTFGRWDLRALELQQPVEAQLFTVTFYASVLVVLANMFLAVVTNASSEANATPPSVELAQSILPMYGRDAMHGDFVGFLLNASTRIARIAADPAHRLHSWLPQAVREHKRRPDAAVITPVGRVWFPAECLVPRIRPLRCSMLLRLMQHDRLHNTAFGSMIPFVLQAYLDFRVRQHVLHAHDANRNDAEAVRYAEAYAVEIVPHMAQRRLLGGGAASWNQHQSAAFGAGAGTVGSFGTAGNHSMHSHASTIVRNAAGSGKTTGRGMVFSEEETMSMDGGGGRDDGASSSVGGLGGEGSMASPSSLTGAERRRQMWNRH